MFTGLIVTIVVGFAADALLWLLYRALLGGSPTRGGEAEPRAGPAVGADQLRKQDLRRRTSTRSASCPGAEM